MFNKGDRIRVIDYPDGLLKLGSEGTIILYDGMYWRATIDSDPLNDYGYLFLPTEIELIPVEQPYDPTQMGDTDDDI